MNNKQPPQTGMDFPHDMPPSKRYVASKYKAPQMTKRERKRAKEVQRRMAEAAR